MGYGKLPSLIRTVYCKTLKPKFIMRPMQVEFLKKIVMQ